MGSKHIYQLSSSQLLSVNSASDLSLPGVFYSWHSWTLNERFLYKACCVAKLNGGAGCHLLVCKRVWADIPVWCVSVKVLQFFDSPRVKVKRSQKDIWQCSSCSRWPERTSVYSKNTESSADWKSIHHINTPKPSDNSVNYILKVPPEDPGRDIFLSVSAFHLMCCIESLIGHPQRKRSSL